VILLGGSNKRGRREIWFGSMSFQSRGVRAYSRSDSSDESSGDWIAGGSGSESGYSSVDEQVGLGGRRTPMSSLISEGSSNSISLFGGGDLSGESSISYIVVGGVLYLGHHNTKKCTIKHEMQMIGFEKTSRPFGFDDALDQGLCRGV